MKRGEESYIGGHEVDQDMGKLREDFKQTELKLEKRRCGDGRRSRQVFKDRDKNGCNEESQWRRPARANVEQGREEAALRI